MGIIKVVAGERFTPLTLARKLGAQVILESSSFQKGRERYSILMVKEAFRVVQRDDTIFLKKYSKHNIKALFRCSVCSQFYIVNSPFTLS